MLRTLDMGPSADKTEEARAFRAFWGDKAELRRFQVRAIFGCKGVSGSAATMPCCHVALCGSPQLTPRLPPAACLPSPAQDGAIAEALVWEEGGPAGRHLIVDAMLRYALCRHLPAGTSVTGLAGALDRALHRKHSSLDADVQATKLCEAAAERLGCVAGGGGRRAGYSRGA